MASARKLKAFRNKTWFRNKRGGVKLTPSKDLPWYAQSKEEAAKNDETGKSDKLERERERETRRIQDDQEHRDGGLCSKHARLPVEEESPRS